MQAISNVLNTEFYHMNQTEIMAEEEEIRLAQKNPKAFEPLYLRYYERICSYVFHRVESKEVAFDITSTVFYKALNNLSSYKPKGYPFSAWLYRVAFNEIQQYYRKNKTQSILSINAQGVSEIIDHIPEKPFAIDDAQLFASLESLKEDEIEIINMRFFEDRSFKEIADILDMKESACKMKLYRILEKLKETLHKL